VSDIPPATEGEALSALDQALAERGSRTALAGLVFAVLFVVGWLLIRTGPSVHSSDARILRYYGDSGHRSLSFAAGLFVVPFAGIAFIWFMGALRDRVVRAGGTEHPLFSSVHLISGTVFVSAIFGLGAAELAATWLAEAASDRAVNVDAIRAMLALEAAMAQIYTLRAAAVFVAVSSTRGLRAGLFPKWFGIGGVLTALALLLVATAWRPVVLVIPVWVLVASVLILMARPNRQEATAV